jgi:hypothetical protein
MIHVNNKALPQFSIFFPSFFFFLEFFFLWNPFMVQLDKIKGIFESLKGYLKGSVQAV